jgi:predicted aspartyl protease
MHLLNIELVNLEENSYHIFVEGTVNGKACRVLIDSGASKTVFDRVFLQSLEPAVLLTENDKLSSGLGTNTMKSETATLNHFNIGSKEIKNYETAVLDLTHVNQSYAKLGFGPVHVILGNDILIKCDAVIDYGNKSLSLN